MFVHSCAVFKPLHARWLVVARWWYVQGRRQGPLDPSAFLAGARKGFGVPSPLTHLPLSALPAADQDQDDEKWTEMGLEFQPVA